VSSPATTSASGPAASIEDADAFGDDLPAAFGDVIVDHDGEPIPVPFSDPDSDGADPDEVEPRDGSTSGIDDEG
jgi:hypothetical protein